MLTLLPYNPGVLPNKKPPNLGDKIEFRVDGQPPIKNHHFSLRNPKNKKYDDFVRLRNAATTAMNGRAWYFGAIGLEVTLYYPSSTDIDVNLINFIGGIEDTLDGSSGVYFTYLPIVYEDDCQIVTSSFSKQHSNIWFYTVKINFL
jgi:hypothetical protein